MNLLLFLYGPLQGILPRFMHCRGHSCTHKQPADGTFFFFVTLPQWPSQATSGAAIRAWSEKKERSFLHQSYRWCGAENSMLRHTALSVPSLRAIGQVLHYHVGLGLLYDDLQGTVQGMYMNQVLDVLDTRHFLGSDIYLIPSGSPCPFLLFLRFDSILLSSKSLGFCSSWSLVITNKYLVQRGCRWKAVWQKKKKKNPINSTSPYSPLH